MLNRISSLRALTLIAIAIPIIFFSEFSLHAIYHFSGSVQEAVIIGEWPLVLINIIIFSAFFIPLTYRRRANWREYGVVGGFFVSLFIEMYGIPFSILLIANYLAGPGWVKPNVMAKATMLGVSLGFTIGMLYATVLIVAGMILIVTGWVTLYRNKQLKIVTKGIYRFSRHPQYLGFLLIIIGWVVGWPTLFTTAFASILIYKYIRLCREEEKEIGNNQDYREYMKQVPFLI
jgi:protein-S-isoprenylcysteine O-methyltransferase Ste14